MFQVVFGIVLYNGDDVKTHFQIQIMCLDIVVGSFGQELYLMWTNEGIRLPIIGGSSGFYLYDDQHILILCNDVNLSTLPIIIAFENRITQTN